MRAARARLRAVVAEPLRSTAARGAGTRARCTPTCCRCRRAPGSRSRTRCARRGRSTPWRPRPAASASAGGERVDGPRRVQRDAERALHQARAPRRAGAAPPGTSRSATPYCRRSLAYSVVMSSTPSMCRQVGHGDRERRAHARGARPRRSRHRRRRARRQPASTGATAAGEVGLGRRRRAVAPGRRWAPMTTSPESAEPLGGTRAVDRDALGGVGRGPRRAIRRALPFHVLGSVRVLLIAVRDLDRRIILVGSPRRTRRFDEHRSAGVDPDLEACGRVATDPEHRTTGQEHGGRHPGGEVSAHPGMVGQVVERGDIPRRAGTLCGPWEPPKPSTCSSS